MSVAKFYINLDRVPERRRHMEGHFRESGIEGLVRWPATDAGAPDALRDTNYSQASGNSWSLTASEIACFESHRRIWSHVVAEGLAAAAIFEDDILVSRSASGAIDEILSAPEAYDIVKLDLCPKQNRFGAERKLGRVRVRPILTKACSAAGYIVSRRGCEKLLSWSEAYCEHLDDFILRPRSDWAPLQCFPAVAVQFMFYDGDGPEGLPQSVLRSERTQDPGINRTAGRAPASFRAKKEVFRLLGKLYWRTIGDAKLARRRGLIGRVPYAPDL